RFDIAVAAVPTADAAVRAIADGGPDVVLIDQPLDPAVAFAARVPPGGPPLVALVAAGQGRAERRLLAAGYDQVMRLPLRPQQLAHAL
ncbi:hypothetical protein ABTH32_20080, partial [Acinetobacter baumannii]